MFLFFLVWHTGHHVRLVLLKGSLDLDLATLARLGNRLGTRLQQMDCPSLMFFTKLETVWLKTLSLEWSLYVIDTYRKQKAQR